MLVVNNLCKNYGEFSLKEVSFTLEKGYIMGLIGANGAGKTTLINLIMGLLKADCGEVKIDGVTIKDEEEFKNLVGIVYDELHFPKDLKVSDYKKMCKAFYKEFNEGRFDELLKRFEIDKKKKIKLLSKGQKVKLMFSNALSHNAKVFILDEPTSGLDPLSRKEILKLLQEEIEGGEKSVLFSTHITSDLEDIADFITFINKGEIVFTKDMEEIRDSFKVVRGRDEDLKKSGVEFISLIKRPYYTEGLYKVSGEEIENSTIATIEDIFCHYVKEGK